MAMKNMSGDISTLGHKYCSEWLFRQRVKFPFWDFVQEISQLWKFQKCLYFIVFLLFIPFPSLCMVKKGLLSAHTHRAFLAFYPEGDCVFNIKNVCKISDKKFSSDNEMTQKRKRKKIEYNFFYWVSKEICICKDMKFPPPTDTK